MRSREPRGRVRAGRGRRRVRRRGERSLVRLEGRLQDERVGNVAPAGLPDPGGRIDQWPAAESRYGRTPRGCRSGAHRTSRSSRRGRRAPRTRSPPSERTRRYTSIGPSVRPRPGRRLDLLESPRRERQAEEAERCPAARAIEREHLSSLGRPDEELPQLVVSELRGAVGTPQGRHAPSLAEERRGMGSRGLCWRRRAADARSALGSLAPKSLRKDPEAGPLDTLRPEGGGSSLHIRRGGRQCRGTSGEATWRRARAS